MRITAVEAEVRRIPFAGEVRPAWAPGTVWTDKATTVYRVETDDGITGYGAGQGTPGLVRERVAPRLVGQDPFRIEHLFRATVNWGGGLAGLPIACAIEMALWDIVGKAAGLYRHTQRLLLRVRSVLPHLPKGRQDRTGNRSRARYLLPR